MIRMQLRKEVKRRIFKKECNSESFICRQGNQFQDVAETEIYLKERSCSIEGVDFFLMDLYLVNRACSFIVVDMAK